MASDPSALGRATLWTGWDVRRGAAAPAQPADAFAHMARLGPGAERRYELIAVAARGFRPPRFVSVAELSGDEQSGTSDESPQTGETVEEGLRQTWALSYRCIAETGPEVVAPYAIYLLGVNPPPGAIDAELGVFNDFYTNVHLPEVAARHRAMRALRHELEGELRPPQNGAPRFLAVYEVDEESAANRRHVGPPYASGPDVWQRHTTPWRLWYRRVVDLAGGTHR